MHHAPSVQYPVRRSSLLGLGLLGVWLAGAGVTMLTASSQAPPWRHALALAVLLGSALGAWRFWRGLLVGHLRWDGLAWYGPQNVDWPASLQVQLDFQRHLLVRLDFARNAPVGAVAARWMAASHSWLWLEATADPLRWQDLRRAAFASARAPAEVGTSRP